ncbi:Nucleolar protein 13 [Wickerhamiella sorbophila]|uniref:Nucleolar protein 13 n=1 Tax=Wickerhamiella sorbophila TaxID=45607 RepID=A0A2T0FMU6_9ASCO|nr:Nucleolar protein 13 [Wickerhamiella sorbophila]PRT56306.1 Nucleolar protein 13 [Wickerhamiella sorbophila]
MGKRELEEIEVDITKPTPLSKKQKRLLKKGKIEEPKPEIAPEPKPDARSKWGVWVGNMSFDTTESQLREFLIDNATDIQAEHISRVKLVSKKGFAYVDFTAEEQMKQAIGLSESSLGGRNLLIKDARSFEGRPSKAEQESKNPPSRILFVGNLSFDSTDDEIRMLFQHCGEIQKIRTATFQDSGKCKGFTFIDFADVEGATKALNDKRCRKLNGRQLRMEYGEDRSKRRPKAHEEAAAARSEGAKEYREPRPAPTEPEREPRPRPAPRPRKPARPTPGQALSNAARAKNSIVESTGKKITFD